MYLESTSGLGHVNSTPNATTVRIWPVTCRVHRNRNAGRRDRCQLWSVTLVEIYAVSAAAVGVLAGWRARCGGPDLNSWAAYGPARRRRTHVDHRAGRRRRHAAAGPRPVSLVLVLGGSLRRPQAPVVTGGLTLVVLALHEIAPYWDLVPRWIPLLIGGLVLVGVAACYERRRRDLARLRHSRARMS
jgi:hypothetical protein